VKALPRPACIFIGFICAVLAAVAGILLPLIVHGVRNLPWEIIFGSAFYVTWFFRSALGERFEGLIGGVLWPLVVFGFVWFAASRICAADAFVRVASLALFILSLAACVPAATANSLGSRIPLFFNECSVRY